VPVGSASEELRYLKSIALQLYLFGYELPGTFCPPDLPTVTVLASRHSPPLLKLKSIAPQLYLFGYELLGTSRLLRPSFCRKGVFVAPDSSKAQVHSPAALCPWIQALRYVSDQALGGCGQLQWLPKEVKVAVESAVPLPDSVAPVSPVLTAVDRCICSSWSSRGSSPVSPCAFLAPLTLLFHVLTIIRGLVPLETAEMDLIRTLQLRDMSNNIYICTPLQPPNL